MTFATKVNWPLLALLYSVHAPTTANADTPVHCLLEQMYGECKSSYPDHSDQTGLCCSLCARDCDSSVGNVTPGVVLAIYAFRDGPHVCTDGQRRDAVDSTSDLCWG